MVIPSGTTTLGGNSAPGGKTMPFLNGQQDKGRPFLYLTPHALHKVLGPNGPHLHCGVSHDPQFKQIVALLCFLTAFVFLLLFACMTNFHIYDSAKQKHQMLHTYP